MTNAADFQRLRGRLALLKSQLTEAENQGDAAAAERLRLGVAKLERSLSGLQPEPVQAEPQPMQPQRVRERLENWASIKTLVTAPYRFVPLNETIVLPECPGLPMDEPLAGDGSATLTVVWGIETPLLIGKTVSEQHGDVAVPMHLGGKDNWVIPGATLRGSVRSSLEIIAFARLRQINDHFRFGVRDFTHQRYRDEQQIGNDKGIRAGWLRKEGDDHLIEPCGDGGAAWGYVEIESLPGITNPETWSRKTRSQKYTAMNGKLSAFRETGTRPLQSHKIYRPDDEGDPGVLVVSDKAVGKKRYEYVFFADAEAVAKRIEPGPWHNFLVMNCRQGRSGLEPDGAWAELEKKVRDGEKVPVFWVGDLAGQGSDFAFGLTRLFKIPHTYRVGEKLPEEHRPRLAPGGKPERDFVENLFGYVDERDDLAKIPGGHQLGNSLAHQSRIAFSFAKPVDRGNFAYWPDAKRRFKTITMAPRASYAPYYLVGSVKDWSHPDSRLAGRKRYPPRYRADELGQAEAELHERLKDPEERIVAASKEAEGPKSDDVFTRLRFLRPTTTDAAFQGTIKLHNVTAIELGAVLWGLTFGNDTNELYRHMLGRAKGMGAGQTAVRRIEIEWRPHVGEPVKEAWPSAADDALPVRMMKSFEDYMQRATDGAWRTSEPITAYLKLHAPGTWAGMGNALAAKVSEIAAADKRQRVVWRWESDHPLATSFLGRPDPVNDVDRATTNDFQRVREAAKLAYSGYKPPDPAIPERLLIIPT